MKHTLIVKNIQELYSAFRPVFQKNFEEYFPAGISPVESRFIGYIGERQEQGISVISKDLTRDFGLKKATVSGNIASLVEKGYLEIARDREDKRMKSLTLTPKGLEYHHKVTPILEKFDASFNAYLTEEEIEEWNRISQKLLNAVKERSKKK